MDDEENGVCEMPEPDTFWSSSVSPSDEGGTSSNTLTMLECNDCTLSRLVACLKQDSRVGMPADYSFPGSFFTDKPLAVNVVGLRIKDSVSNKFDDRMVIFYRPVDLDGPTKVNEPDSYTDLNVPEIEAFLKSAKPGGDLKLEGDELPGKPSVNTDKKECRVHAGWKILKFPITTDPGWQKKSSPDNDVPVGGDGGGYLAQGRASLRSGRYTGSHHVGLHHGSKMNGYTAMTQTGNVTVRRGYTGKYLKAKVKEAEKGWEAAYKSYKKKTKTPAAEDAWMPDYLAGLVGKVQEVRQDSLSGAVVGSAVTTDYTMVQVAKDPAKPEVLTWVLTVNGLKSGERVITDTDVIVLASTGVFGINLHCSNPDPGKPSPTYDPNVYNWSEGCQVYKGMSDFKQFRAVCELSKHGRCSKRKASASSPCPSMKEKITLEDVLYIHFANDSERSAYVGSRLTTTPADRTTAADAMLRTKVTGDAKDGNFVQGVQDRVNAIDFNASPGSGPAASPAPKLSASKSAKSARTTAINDVVKAHLLPGAADDDVRKKISITTLQTKLETYMQADLLNDPTLKAKIDEKAALKTTASEKKKVISDPEVVSLQSTQEAEIQKRKLDKLATELDSLTKEMEDRIDWTIKDIKKKREAKRDQWNDEGYELCDLLWKCDQKVDYLLAEVDKSFVEEVDKRY